MIDYDFKISPHLKRLAQKSPAIKKQFFPDLAEEKVSLRGSKDPFNEEKQTPVKGLIQRYPNRALILVTPNCAAHCRFCFRRHSRKEAPLTRQDLEKIFDFLKTKPAISEVIFSGGDPLLAPKLLLWALKKLDSQKQIKILRIHTRLPIAEPKAINQALLEGLKKLKKPLYIAIHFEHPDELSTGTVKAIGTLRQSGAILLSQTVFLKGINDSLPVLEALFNRLVELGVRPYYLMHCDPVVGAEHFAVPLKKEIEIASQLRKRLSGIACPLYIIDAPHGNGKIPIPLDFWQADLRRFWDFNRQEINLESSL